MTEEQFLRISTWFATYCSSFSCDNVNDRRHFFLKEEHTHNVCFHIRRIASGEGISGDGLLLAETAALLHDVGRFEQYRRFRTFRDDVSVNHAALGSEIIREADLLAELSSHESDVILHAVEHHNAFIVPDGTGGDALHFLQLLRDADKLDIWRVFIENYQLPVEKRSSVVQLGFPDSPHCSPEVLEQLARRESVCLSSARTLSDFKLLQISWVYDLNFSESLRIVKENDSVGRIAATLPGSDDVFAAVEDVLAFIAERTEKD